MTLFGVKATLANSFFKLAHHMRKRRDDRRRCYEKDYTYERIIENIAYALEQTAKEMHDEIEKDMTADREM